MKPINSLVLVCLALSSVKASENNPKIVNTRPIVDDTPRYGSIEKLPNGIRVLTMKNFCRLDYDRNVFNEILNAQELSDSESLEDGDVESETRYRFDQLHVTVGGENGNRFSKYFHDYNSELFQAAVATFKIDRLNELVAKKKHLFLNPKEKMKVIKLALESLINEENETSKAENYEILRILLQNNFYPGEENLRQKLCATDRNGNNLMIEIIKDPHAVEIFHEYDPNFFSNQDLVMEAVRRKD